jgi:large subunit ribosomal protein L18
MNRLAHKNLNTKLRHQRVRSRVSGTSERPRLTVHISNHHITAQLIDDSSSQTLAYASTVGQKGLSGTLSDQAAAIGAEIAKRAKAVKVKQVVFDRGSKLYHGRIKALAEAARTEGLEF